MTQYLPSTKPGKVWQVSIIKNPKCANRISAIEGVAETVKGVTTFTWAPFSNDDRLYDCWIGKNTKKNREHAFAVLLSDMIDLGMVPPDTMIAND